MPTEAGPGPTILLTNDDGHHARGLAAFRDALEEAGARVVVVAPSSNQSGVGHRVSTGRRLRLARVGRDMWALDGSPADCVRVALLGRLVTPALVVSGINHGANAGDDLHYSGTLAAAAEGVLLGLPALAVSQNGDGADLPFLTTMPHDFPDAAYAADVAMWMASAAGSMAPGHMVNLNLPRQPMTQDATLTRVGIRRWRDAGVRRSAGRHSDEWLVDPWDLPPPASMLEATDFVHLSAGRATLTALRVDRGIQDADIAHCDWASTVPRRAARCSRTGM